MNRQRILLVFFLGLLFSCAHHTVTYVPNRPYPEVPAFTIIEGLKKRQYLFHEPVDIEAKIDFGGKIGSSKTELMLARPSWLYMAVPPMGGPISPRVYVGISPENFQIHDLENDQFFYGHTNACSLHRASSFFPDSLEPEELLEILLGSAPLPKEIMKADVSWQGDAGGRELLVLTDAQENVEKLWLSSALEGNILRAEFYKRNQSKPAWVLTHEDFKIRGKIPVPLPGKTTFYGSNGSQAIKIQWNEWNISPEIVQPWQAQFRLQIPANTKIERVECSTRNQAER